MFTLVIGGSASGVGKTTLACALLRAMPEFGWTAIKITSHDHGRPAVYEEPAAGEGSDTARYLAAGARRSLLVSAPEKIPLAELDAACNGVTHVLMESNRILEHLLPDACLAVVGESDAKASFSSLLHRADAILVRSRGLLERVRTPASACVFELADCGCPPPELITWLRGRVQAVLPAEAR